MNKKIALTTKTLCETTKDGECFYRELRYLDGADCALYKEELPENPWGKPKRLPQCLKDFGPGPIYMMALEKG